MFTRRAFLLRAGLAAVVLQAAAAGAAERPLGVVELFTSQGCSSCPPADVVLAELATRGDIVALAYHVDYWDYLGWRDTMGSAENTRRQRDYSAGFGSGSVYTPQAVINGRVHVNGADRISVDGAIERMADTADGLTVDVSVSRDGDSIIIETGPAPGRKRNAHLVLVYFDRVQTVEIKRGENSGKTVTYWNAVTGIQTVGMWHGTARRYELPVSEIARKGSGGCAVLLQEARKNGLPGPVLGATIMAKPSS